MGATYSKNNQEGKTVLITGANSGIGYHTALELGRAGAHVVCLCRDEERGTKAVDGMKAAAPNGKFELEILDVSSMASVNQFVRRWEKRTDVQRVDTLINNAGIMMSPTRDLTVDGLEAQWATNVLGHYALTGLLMPQLAMSKDPRVVNVASLMAWTGAPKKETFLDFVKDTGYDRGQVYGDTKLANLMFTSELAKRYPGLTVTAAHPGGTSTNLQKHAFGSALCRLFLQSSPSGALPSLRAATDNKATSGSYFGPRLSGVGAGVYGVIPGSAKDATLNAKLWDASAKVTKVNFDPKILHE